MAVLSKASPAASSSVSPRIAYWPIAYTGAATQLSGDSVSMGSVLGSGIYANDTLTVRTTADYAFGTGRLLVFARF